MPLVGEDVGQRAASDDLPATRGGHGCGRSHNPGPGLVCRRNDHLNRQINRQAGLKETRVVDGDVLQWDFVVETYSIVYFEPSGDGIV